jgi:broad specificity phosphatase PhoE
LYLFLTTQTQTLIIIQDYWSLQDGDEDGDWVDARLTEQGRRQAEIAKAAWEQQIDAGIPLPERYYVSPLNRCLETAQITFMGILGRPFEPVIKEVCCVCVLDS